MPIETIAGAPAFVVGIAVVRGTPSPIVDAARLLGDTAEHRITTSAQARFISLQLGPRSACLAVDAVLDIRRVPADQLRETPPLLGDSAAALRPLLGTLDRELLIVLDAARLVPEAVWTSLHAVETRA